MQRTGSLDRLPTHVGSPGHKQGILDSALQGEYRWNIFTTLSPFVAQGYGLDLQGAHGLVKCMERPINTAARLPLNIRMPGLY